MKRSKSMLRIVIAATLALSFPALHQAAHGAPANKKDAVANPGSYPASNLLDTKIDILGQPVSYPDCPARVHSDIITMQPGQVGGKHTHETPLYAHILSGTISVDYEGIGTKTYKAGDTFIEAMHVVHHGYNESDAPVSLLAVYIDCDK